MTDTPSGEVLLYQREDGSPAIEVRLDAETVWLSQQQIAELFQTSQQNVSLHLRNIYSEGELDEAATHKDFLSVRPDAICEKQQPVGNSDRFARRAVLHAEDEYAKYREHLDAAAS